MARYVTRFELTNPVNDYDAAADYLREPMTEYLINDLDYLHLEHLQGKIENIEWVLEDEESGYIELTTTEPIAWDDLVKISDWVRGQCSDGLGEGFEQQPFAEVRYKDEDEDGYLNYDTDMASFDWRTNKYRFIKVSDSRKVKDGLQTTGYEYDAFNSKQEGENTYLQVAALGNPDAITEYGYGEYATEDYTDDYYVLQSSDPEDVLDLWHIYAYNSDVAINLPRNDKYIVDEDNDSMYLLIRVDRESDIAKYQSGNWGSTDTNIKFRNRNLILVSVKAEKRSYG